MAKHIGIVACSAEGAALCYRTICVEGAALFGTHNHPEITMHTIPLADYMAPIYREDWNSASELILYSARKLKDVGADFLICPDNTLHQAIDLIVDKSPLPWLHIAVEVASAAKSRGNRRVGVLGTRYLM
ncbi:MAG TPA: aspartate/glutamate racemase family protein, partial [Candidatus Binataceae bacterium]|nr:aspartate/glutamate racemase family protein [Candidatus Binataceae bacterium]